jgi:hypothetical protein
MITTRSLQPDDELAALQTLHAATMQRLARLERAVEKLEITERSVPSRKPSNWPTGDPDVLLPAPLSVWREIREALDAG